MTPPTWSRLPGARSSASAILVGRGLAAGQRSLRRRAPGARRRRRWRWRPCIGRRRPRVALRLAVEPGRRGLGRRRRRCPRRWRPATARSSSTRPCPAGSSATCTAGVRHGRDAGDAGRGAAAVVLGAARRPGRAGRPRGGGAARAARRRCGASVPAGAPLPAVVLRAGGRAGGCAGRGARVRRGPVGCGRRPTTSACGLLARRAWPGVVLASCVAWPGTSRRSSSPPAPSASTASPASCCRWPCSCWSPMGVPLNVAGWGPREGVAAWAFAPPGWAPARAWRPPWRTA